MKVVTIDAAAGHDIIITDDVKAVVITDDAGIPLVIWAQLEGQKYISQNSSEPGFENTLALLGFKKDDFKN